MCVGQFLKHWLASATFRNSCSSCEWKLMKGREPSQILTWERLQNHPQLLASARKSIRKLKKIQGAEAGSIFVNSSFKNVQNCWIFHQRQCFYFVERHYAMLSESEGARLRRHESSLGTGVNWTRPQVLSMGLWIQGLVKGKQANFGFLPLLWDASYVT